MLTFNNLEEMKKYYNKVTNTYEFNDDVEFNFNLSVESHIRAMNVNARNIDAWNINAGDIDAWNINAWNIDAWNIKARNISYYAVCFAYKNITCTSIEGRRDNHKHFVLDGEVIIRPIKTTVTLELTEEQLAKIKEVLGE